jgi:hypothetical protein
VVQVLDHSDSFQLLKFTFVLCLDSRQLILWRAVERGLFQLGLADEEVSEVVVLD